MGALEDVWGNDEDGKYEKLYNHHKMQIDWKKTNEQISEETINSFRPHPWLTPHEDCDHWPSWEYECGAYHALSCVMSMIAVCPDELVHHGNGTPLAIKNGTKDRLYEVKRIIENIISSFSNEQ